MLLPSMLLYRNIPRQVKIPTAIHKSLIEGFCKNVISIFIIPLIGYNPLNKHAKELLQQFSK